MRIGGLSSGMDIDQMVGDLMRARRLPLDALFQKKTLLEWKKADYNGIYTSVRQFRDTVFNYKLQSTLAPKTATAGDETLVTVKANSEAANVTHTLRVTELADGVKKSSSAAITTGESKDTIADQFGITGTFDLKITNGSETATVTVDTAQSIYELVSNINKAGVNVQANYDATLDRFFLYTANTGAGAEISFAGSDAAGLDFLQNNLKLNIDPAQGKDAAFELDGVSLTQATNTFTISGVTYSLKKAAPGETTTVMVAADATAAVAGVKAFVEAYNDTLSKVYGKYSEDRYKEFLPLTDAQRKELKETEITAWEAKAKSGMLHGDPILRELTSRIRSNLSSAVSGLTGVYTSASSIGITTGSYQENGKLYLDESKLRAALEADPDVLSKIFGTDGDTAGADGIAVRLHDSLNGFLDRIQREAGLAATTTGADQSNLARRIREATTGMSALEDRLAGIEERYYKQFTAMEKAISRLNSQSAWLAQQFAPRTG
ncbi:MAG: flagellar filament capping protein FliD [Heliobacteriaceae bacterium]|nr:flagellar filament capping protein FliD [Heliobacteriaceae bacterium]